MAEIVLNVEVRERTGTGGARAARREGKVPGVLYGGPRGPVPIAMNHNEFGKALYTGKLLGHLVTLRYGEERQPVIAREVQFDPVTDRPMHFDLYRVDAHQSVRIAVVVHFRNHDESPGLKRGGALTVARHDVEVMAPADRIPEELIADLTGLDIGDAIRISNIVLPEGVTPTITDRDFVIATVTGSSAQVSEEAGEGPAEAGAGGGEEAAAEDSEG
jgi:large subunit ribosomal protein L25